MDDRSFYDIDKKNRSKSMKKVTMPLLDDIVQVEFRKGHREMFFKTAFIQEQNEKLKLRGCP